jgi:hypothetical protein
MRPYFPRLRGQDTQGVGGDIWQGGFVGIGEDGREVVEDLTVGQDRTVLVV